MPIEPSRYRGMTEVIYGILKSCEHGGCTRNIAVTENRIRWTVIDTYINYMVDKGLITSETHPATGSRYFLTKKGQRAVELLDEVFGLIRSEAF